MHPLRFTRIAVSSIVTAAVLLFFLDVRAWVPAGVVNAVLMTQFAPSVLALVSGAGGAALAVGAILVITLLFGRVYCSYLCPLGAVQDVAIWIRSRNYRHRRFPYAAASYGWHYAITVLVIVSALFGSLALLNALEPFSNVGRTVTYLIRPPLVVLNNLAAFVSRSVGAYGLAEVPVGLPGVWVSVGALLFTIFIVFLSYSRGRLFCNLLCPVGGVLSLVSRKPLFAIRIHDHACIDCGVCERVCRAQCIDSGNHRVDPAACVGCFDCLDSCPTGGMEYHWKETGSVTATEPTRRRVLSALGMAAAVSSTPDAGNNTVQEAYERAHATGVVPPGGESLDRFHQLCTGCQVCVGSCPTQVLQPAVLHYGWDGVFQPRMDYAVNYCTFDCLRCGQVCPTGAIRELTPERKHMTQLGTAVFLKEDCIVEVNKKDCGACAEHCPTKAVRMVPYEGKLQIPEVDNAYCVGCGACEHACPTEPRRAIYIKPHEQHRFARVRLAETSEPVESVPEMFPF